MFHWFLQDWNTCTCIFPDLVTFNPCAYIAAPCHLSFLSCLQAQHQCVSHTCQKQFLEHVALINQFVVRKIKQFRFLTKLFKIKIALDELKKVGRYFPFKIKLINLVEYFRKTLTYQQKLLAIGYWVSVNEYTARASARVKKSKLFRMSWKTFWFWHF